MLLICVSSARLGGRGGRLSNGLLLVGRKRLLIPRPANEKVRSSAYRVYCPSRFFASAASRASSRRQTRLPPAGEVGAPWGRLPSCVQIRLRIVAASPSQPNPRQDSATRSAVMLGKKSARSRLITTPCPTCGRALSTIERPGTNPVAAGGAGGGFNKRCSPLR